MIDEVLIYVGSFGSGKTEIAINYSLKKAQEKKNGKVIIADLDIVNPYFCSREMKEILEIHGVTVISPTGQFSMADAPFISPEIKGVLEGSERIFILDVGGDDIGSRSLSGFYPILKNIHYQMNLVVNPFRPFTKNYTEIKKMLDEIEIASRLKVNNLISNPNLGLKTDIETLIKGHEIVKEVSEKLYLPIKYLVIDQKIFQKIKDCSFIKNQKYRNLFIIERFMELPWEKTYETGLFKQS